MAWSLQPTLELTEKQFSQWRKLLELKTGVHLTDQQKGLLQTTLSIRMRELGFRDCDEYFSQLDEGIEGIVEWYKLVDRIMVQETRFFRDPEALAYVNELLLERIDNQCLDGSFELWSVGCSTGEEPYSLAMVVDSCFESADIEPRYGVTATDISLEALAKGRRAIYKKRHTAQLSEHFRKRYFVSVDEDHDQVCAWLRERVCFAHGNIRDIERSPISGMDIIFCHNMLIYFRKWMRKEILDELVKRLKPQGVLIIAVGEVVDWDNRYVRRLPNDKMQAYVRISD